jgi:hypothetical protein
MEAASFFVLDRVSKYRIRSSAAGPDGRNAEAGGGQQPDLAFLRAEKGEGERFRHRWAADAPVGQLRNKL